MQSRLGLALALALYPCAFAMAQSTSTIEAPPGSGVRLPKFVITDPATGNPITNFGGGAVYGPDATGVAPTKAPLFIAGIGPDGKILPFTFTASGLQMFDQAAELALGSTNDPAATITNGAVGNGSTIAQLKASVNQLAAIVAKLGGTLTVDGSAKTQPTSEADGANVALGAKADVAATASGSSGSISALLKAIRDKQISGQTVTDAQNAPYGLSGAANITAGAPGSSTTPGRAMKVRCPASTSPGSGAAPIAGTGYVVLTLASGQAVQQELANGGAYVVPYAVASVGSQVVETGTLATCTYQNVN